MGTYLNKLGFIGWLGDQIGARMGGLDTVAAFAALTGVYALTHYLFASGTAHTASMFAVFLGAIPAPMGCLTHYTHYGNGPAPLYFGSGYVELGTWWRTGLVLGIVHMAIWLVVGPIWWSIIGVW